MYMYKLANVCFAYAIWHRARMSGRSSESISAYGGRKMLGATRLRVGSISQLKGREWNGEEG